MRIPKKDLSVLMEVKYFSDDDAYYFKDDNGNILYDDLASEYDYNNTVERVNQLVETYLIVQGSTQLWNGTRDIAPTRCENLSDVISQLRDVDALDIEFDPDDSAIVVRNHHHDGTNVYYVVKPEWYNVDELKRLLLMHFDYDRKEVNEITNEYFGRPISALTKDELIELVGEVIETC